jgi:transcriptional regulator with XRE-family HTH domain
MAEVVSPTVARRRVRLALREARERADLTQQQVAEEMEWSLSKVIRIENGDVSISPNDLRPLLSYLGVKDRTRIAALIADAKVARTRQHLMWWQTPEFRALGDPLLKLIEYEAVATASRIYSIRYVPGPLQLPEYATALTGSFDELPQERLDMLVESRRLRREALLNRLGSFKYYLVFDESVFMRTTGGPVIFAAQLRELQRLAEKDLIHLRMLPFKLDTPIANNASFDLLSLGDSEAGDQVLYRENGLVDELIEDKDLTARHLARFIQLQQVATDEADTIEFLKRRIESLENTVTNGESTP